MSDNILNDPQSLDTPIRPTWCPGCGNFSIWLAIKQAAVKLQIPHQDLVIVFDVGCSGNMTDFMKVYGFHALHGRAIPPATGIKLANHKLKVLVVIGDGGGYGEGLTHFINEMRGNHDITVVIHNNHRYSLTTGQMSPTTPKGTKTPSTPLGSIESEINPIAIALANHATFVARGFAVQIPQLTDTITNAINHPGYSVVDVLQPCMVFNPEMDTQWYMQNIIDINQDGHTPDDFSSAMMQSIRTDKIPVGMFWQDSSKEPYHLQDPVTASSTLLEQQKNQIDIKDLLNNFK